MSKRLVLIILLLSGISSFELLCNSPIRALTVNDGLSQGMVFDVLQTRDGFLWIAIKDGLNRYDGKRFDVFAQDAFDPFSPGSDQMVRLFEDSRGYLWIAYEGGIDMYVPQQGKFYHLELPVKWEVVYRGHSFVETPDGNVWVLGSSFIGRINTSGIMEAMERGKPTLSLPVTLLDLRWKNHVLTPTSILYSTKAGFLMAYGKGLYAIKDISAPVLQLEEPAYAEEEVTLIGCDEEGQAWILVNDRLVGRIADTEIYRSKPVPKCDYWLLDKAGYFWNVDGSAVRKWSISPKPGGANTLELLQTYKLPETNETFYLTTFASDRNGHVWIGTSGYGVLHVVDLQPKFRSYFSRRSFGLLAEPTSGLLVECYVPKTEYNIRSGSSNITSTWQKALLPDEVIHDRARDQEGGHYLLSSRSRLLYLSPNAQAIKEIGNWPAVGLLLTKDSCLAGVTEKGLWIKRLDTGKETFHPFEQNMRFARPDMLRKHHFLFEDTFGNLWIYCFEGLVKAVRASDTWKFEWLRNDPTNRESLSKNIVLCIASDPLEPERYLWIGTQGGGLNRLDFTTGKFRHFSTKSGLPDNVIYGILTDAQGHWWISTNKGLSRMSRTDQDEYSFLNFTVADGLQSNEFNRDSYLKLGSGHLVFGGVSGITIFHPDSLVFNQLPPPIKLVNIKVNQEALQRADVFKAEKGTLRFNHQQRLLSFDFAALDFTNPAQNHYKYKLLNKGRLGFKKDTDWISLGNQNTLQFSSLSPGKYELYIIGSNNDGFWSEEPLEISFQVLPPWWFSIWAFLAYIAIGALGLWELYKNQLTRKAERLEALRLRELDAFKTQFFTNITHEFRTPLTVILGIAQQMMEKEDTKSPRKISLIRKNAESLLKLINQILELARLQNSFFHTQMIQGDVVKYLRYLTESFSSLAMSSNIQLDFLSDRAAFQTKYDQEHLGKIVNNLLSNAIKFTPEGGVVRVEVSWVQQEAKRLEILVTDTGAGIPAEELPFVFERFFRGSNTVADVEGTGVGLSLTKELVKALGGEIGVASTLGQGTTFKVTLPLVELIQSTENTVARQDAGEEDPDILYEKSILVIEDNLDVMEYLLDSLNGFHKIYSAANGLEGIQKAIEFIPDIIISDVMMPEKDGYEVCHTLKQDERTSHIPIILLTAKAELPDRITGLRKGADAYLAKPFNEQELLATIDNLLQSREALQHKYGKGLPPKEAPSAQQQTSDPEDTFMQKLRQLVLDMSVDPNIDMELLGKKFSMSRSQLYRKVKALTGRSPTQFIRYIRLQHGKHLLETTSLRVSEIAYASGFASLKYFSDAFLEEYGIRPKQAREHGPKGSL